MCCARFKLISDTLFLPQDIAHKQFSSFVATLPASLVYFNHTKQPVDIKEKGGLTIGKQVYSAQKPCRVWLAIELLCTWEWPTGGAMDSVLPFLKQCGNQAEGSADRELVDKVVQSLFLGASMSSKSTSERLPALVNGRDEAKNVNEPYLRALLMVLNALLEKDLPDAKADAYRMFQEHILAQENFSQSPVRSELRILPQLLSVLMPVLRKRASEGEITTLKQNTLSLRKESAMQLEFTVIEWLNNALSRPPLVVRQSSSQGQGNCPTIFLKA